MTGEEANAIASLVQQAVQSVKDVKDPQMKLIAFGEVLKFFLEHKSHYSKQLPSKKARKTTVKTKSGKSVKSQGPMKWIEELKAEKFFEKPKNTKQILAALEEIGHHIKHTDLTWPLQQSTKRKILRRKKQAPIDGGKPVWHYSNW